MAKRRFVEKRRGMLAVLFCTACLGLAGCGEVVDEGENNVIVERTEYESDYTLETVKRTDVTLTKPLRARYKEMVHEDIYFTEEGRRVTALYVSKGDEVKKGQLLAELEGSNQTEEIKALEYQIARNELLFSYLDGEENNEKSLRWWNFAYQGRGTEEEEERLKADLEAIEEKYQYQREDYQDAIKLDKLRLESLKNTMKAGYVYAGMDGKIDFVRTGLLGSISQTEDEVITIRDSSLCLFEVPGVSYAEYFKEGEVVSMELGMGKNTTTVKIRPYDIENWETNMHFEIVQEDDAPEVKTSDTGVITLELDRRNQVLALSNRVIHTANGGHYVYVLGENNIRQVRWIEIGLEGDKLTEIVSGLTEGESVVLR